MGLIDVPKSKEEIAAYLADGNTRPAPYITSADISDGEILGATKTTDLGGGSYKFSITLPSGRYLESAPVGPDYSKRDATVQWVGAVGSAIIGDSSDAVEAAYEAARVREPVPPPEPSPSIVDQRATPSVQPVYTGADPTEYARAQLRGALERLAALASAEADVERWQKVVDSLTGATNKKRRKKRRQKVSA